MITSDMQVYLFKTSRDWEEWLEKNHAASDGIWMQFAKKNSGLTTVSYDEALDVALCFGWIDSLVKRYDEKSYIQKFSPRRSKSVWSKINTEHAARLIKEKRMRPAGLVQVELAQKDGWWEAAYHPPSTATVPKDFLDALAKNKKAQEFYNTLNKTNAYAIAWRLATAKKPETYEKRKKTILEMLEKGEKFH